MTPNIYKAGAVIAAGILAACSSSDSGGDTTSDLSSPTVVAKQVGNVVATTSSLGGADGAGRKSLQDGQCDSGSMSDIEESGVNVNSPYTSQNFDLFGTRYSTCRLNDEQSNNYFVFNGASKEGFVSVGDDFIDYFTLGEGSTPFTFTVHAEDGNASSDSTFNFDLRGHSRDFASGDFESQLFLMYDGTVGTSGSNIGFSVRFGTADSAGNRFVVGETADGVSIAGNYAIQLDQQIDQQLQCSGSATIATDTPLQTGSSTLFDAGQLTLSSGGVSATVVFNANDTVTITTSSGSQTISQSELQNQGQQCAGFYATGFTQIR